MQVYRNAHMMWHMIRTCGSSDRGHYIALCSVKEVKGPGDILIFQTNTLSYKNSQFSVPRVHVCLLQTETSASQNECIFTSFYDHHNDFLKFPNVSISSLPISWLILSRSTRGKDKIHTRHKRQHNCLVLFHGLVAAQDMIQTQQGPINGWISKACHFLKPM